MKTGYLVKGCGVSLICDNIESVHGWVAYIIEKGGVPEVSEIKGELLI